MYSCEREGDRLPMVVPRRFVRPRREPLMMGSRESEFATTWRESHPGARKGCGAGLMRTLERRGLRGLSRLRSNVCLGVGALETHGGCGSRSQLRRSSVVEGSNGRVSRARIEESVC